MKVSMTRAVVGIAALSLGLSGCGGDQHPHYSANVKFGLRRDPIVKSAKDLSDDRDDTDRPGLLPIMKFDDAFQADSPYRKKLSENAKVAGLLKGLADKNNTLKFVADHRQEFAVALIEVLRDPGQIDEADRREIETNLEKLFGTPAKPTINAEMAEISKTDLAELKLDDATLAKGSTRYRIHCMHCHGVPGDGRGPTARWVNPHPRDFRAGVFKFQSTDRTVNAATMPTRADLLRTVRQGVEGTAMPSFVILSDDDLEAMVSYVMFLSLRGQAEMKTMLEFELDQATNKMKAPTAEPGQKDSPIVTSLKYWTKKGFDEGWLAASKPSALIKVEEYPYTSEELAASVRRGQQIFTGTLSAEFRKEFNERHFKKIRATASATAIANAEAEAIKQAKETQKTLTDDDIAKIKKSVDHEKVMASLDFRKLEEEAKPGIDAKLTNVTGTTCVSCHIDYGRQAKFKCDDWGTLVRPNNFPQGVFRGGKRPVDIYYRIHSGIPGSGMVAFGKTFEGQERYIWDLVNFVSTVSYPAMLKGMDLRLEP
jgi:mono/diheme cytochrome c family protein